MAAPLNHGARGKDARKDFRNTFDEIARMRRKNSAFSRPRRWRTSPCVFDLSSCMKEILDTVAVATRFDGYANCIVS